MPALYLIFLTLSAALILVLVSTSTPYFIVLNEKYNKNLKKGGTEKW